MYIGATLARRKKIALTRKVNLATESSAPLAEEMRESEREFQSLEEEAALVNVVIGKGGLKCQRVVPPDMPNWGTMSSVCILAALSRPFKALSLLSLLLKSTFCWLG